MPRSRGKPDANQAAIVAALRRCGASVQIVASIGRGCPDILVGWRGRNYLFEIKDGTKPPSARTLTPDEQAWHQEWRGQVATVRSLDDAVAYLHISEDCDDRDSTPT